MKEIKRTKTIEEIVGYETEDGRVFKTKEEAEKYEETAAYACYMQFKELMISEPFRERELYESFGYGSEEYYLCVIKIKNETDLKKALMYQQMRDKNCKKFTTDMIGKTLLVALGCDDWDPTCAPVGTYEDLVSKFAREVKPYFEKEEKKDEP